MYLPANDCIKRLFFYTRKRPGLSLNLLSYEQLRAIVKATITNK